MTAKYVVKIALIIFIGFLIIYVLFNVRSEGLEGDNSVNVFDLLSMSYIGKNPSNTQIPTCSSSQIVMVAHPNYVLTCGTLVGDLVNGSRCEVNTSDKYNYTVTCPSALLQSTQSSVGTTPSPVGTKLADTNLTPHNSWNVSDPEMITKQLSKILKQNQTNKQPVTGPYNQTMVSSLTIVSDTDKACPSINDNVTPTPKPINYDQTTTSSGNSVDVIPSSTMYNSAEEIKPSPAASSSSSSTYNISNTSSDKDTSTSNNTKGHTFTNIPFPFLPSFKAS